jgi:hypothetical protein
VVAMMTLDLVSRRPMHGFGRAFIAAVAIGA